MPSVILTLRLLPSPPTDAQNFFDHYLNGLKITAFDRSVADPKAEVEIGTAQGPVVDVPGNLTVNNGPPASLQQSILIHFDIGVVPTRKAVATAVIVCKVDPATHPEFPDVTNFDVRLEITRGSTKIRHDAIEYNISARSVDKLSPSAVDYMGAPGVTPVFPDFVDLPVGAYVLIPAPPPGGPNANAGPVILLDPSGKPPEFGELVKGIDAVLAKDHPPPAGATSLAVTPEPLTAPQAAEIAAELVWNRKYFPLPTPKVRLEDLYTSPSDDGQRTQFEGALTAYYATHNADAERLKGFVYAASAAIHAERLSFRETKASIGLPIDPSMSTSTSATSIPVTLKPLPGTVPAPRLTPSFVVPAAYFYALGISFSVNLTPEKLYKRVLASSADFLSSSLQLAIDSGTITDTPQKTISAEVTQIITANRSQASRRLFALSGSLAIKPQYTAILQGNSGGALTGDVAALVNRWLSQTAPDDQLITSFWPNEYPGLDYLEIILQVISDGNVLLENAIRNFPSPGVHITRASDLVKVKDQQWIDFFLANPTLLPDFTKIGNTEDRAKAYIQFLRTLFSVDFNPPGTITPLAETIPSFGNYDLDMFWKFLSALPGGFDITNFPTDDVITLTLTTSFPKDESTQAWAKQALGTLHDLWLITKTTGNTPDQFQFSSMEALFARGFTSVEKVLTLTQDRFTVALQGTVAWASASAIWNAASELGQISGQDDKPGDVFKPVNPGNLIDCIPPDHLSPLGPVEYIHEALLTESDNITLQSVIESRRGPLGALLASKLNLELELPQIDLVNESLEHLGSDLAETHGMIQNTIDPKIAEGDESDGTLLEASLVASPQHSSPAIPVTSPKIYDDLQNCFTDPLLPYSQAHDISRSYLELLGSTRFETMRRFRQDITELAMDPAGEPPDFQRNLWRYPVRFDIGLEYIQMSHVEFERLFSTTPTNADIALLFGQDPESSWLDRIKVLPNFLKASGLEYCEFYELWQTQFEPLNIDEPNDVLPACPPCCSEKYIISTPNDDSEQWGPPWGRLIIFIRLWRRLKTRFDISFVTLSDICTVLQLFDPQHQTNPDFIRQLVSLLILRCTLSLPWTDEKDQESSSKNEKRTKILSIWVGPQNAPVEWGWAVMTLLSNIQTHAERLYRCPRRPPEFVKILSNNLDSLSRLAGFTDDFPWYLNPSSTLRFTEVLAKIYASEFTVGEIVMLFTTQDHLRGDDPYPFTEDSEAQDDPLNAPEDDIHGLWELRRKLLCVEVSDADIDAWTWYRIHSECLELGMKAGLKPLDVDALTYMGMRFFPSTLQANGYAITSLSKRFSTPLAASSTSPELWTGTHCEAFHYTHDAQDAQSGQLWTSIPLRDHTVFHQLIKSRQLNHTEAGAVKNVYFAPRAALAPFALIFSNFGRDVDEMIHESNETARFRFFQRQFAIFYRRCEILAAHIAERVDALPCWACYTKDCGCGCGGNRPNEKASWRILRSLIADENRAETAWEDDAGKPPPSFEFERFSGSGFAALLGLIGTGLHGKITTENGLDWPEMRGGIYAFGRIKNIWNSPVPTYIPSLQLQLEIQQQDFVALRNGYALEDDHATALGGAQPFTAVWTGLLLIEDSGEYTFSAGHPEDCCDISATDLEKGQKWLMTLQRGQKTWTILNRCWRDAHNAPGHHSKPLYLTKGVYGIVLQFEQAEPKFTDEFGVHQFHTGFEVKYCGPDTGHNRCILPYHRLFQDSKDGSLAQGTEIGGNTGQWLNNQYYSSFRDIRRTYQRAFKAVLFARRFHLSAHEDRCNGQSELGYILDHADLFLGTSYHPNEPDLWKTHHAYFDFNFLPVTDSYFPPDVNADSRVNPSPKRKAALFDSWERLFDYVHLRDVAAKLTRHRRKKRGIWEMFFEAGIQKPTDAHQLIRYFDAELSLAVQVLSFFVPADQVIEVSPLELLDERWATRVLKAVLWLRDIKRSFYAKEYEILLPAQIAADNPNMIIGQKSGNASITEFATKACEEEPGRLDMIKCVNDRLRDRARISILTYLCGMNRVQLPFASIGGMKYAVRPQDISELLLQDVQVGALQRASRIEDAIHAVQTFVQRARIGLEPGFIVTKDFSDLWECRFTSFKTWQAWKRRTLYRESWIHWDDMQQLEKSESFKLFRSELKKDVSTMTYAGRRMWWPSLGWPDAPGVDGLQAVENARLGLQKDSMLEGLSLMAMPDRHGRPTLIAPQTLPSDPPVVIDDPVTPSLAQRIQRAADTRNGKADTLGPNLAEIPVQDFDEVISPPLWLQSAIRMGVRFLRIAASSLPPGFPYYPIPADTKQQVPCCKCHQSHLPCIDEYYFWLSDSSFFSEKDAVQQANHDVSQSDQTDPTSDWDDPEKLPLLLHWPKQPMLHLFWTRLHVGVLDPPRRSDEGLELRGPDGMPQNALNVHFTFNGRAVDSLFFTAGDGGLGFRYDIPTDSAVVTPQVVADNPAAPQPLEKSLTAFPYFIYFSPGASLEPMDSRSVALEMAKQLKQECKFEAALLWCRKAFDALHRDNSWMICPQDTLRKSRAIDVSNGGDGTSGSEAQLTPPSSAFNITADPLTESLVEVPVEGRRKNTTCCPTGPFGDEISRARATMLEYIDILLQWIDQLIKNNSMESFQRATILADTMQRILGPTPTRIESQKQDFSIPYTIGAFKPLPGPLNPRLLQYYDDVSDRKFLIHDFLSSCRLRNGKPKQDIATWGTNSRYSKEAPFMVHSQDELCSDAYQCYLTRCQPYRFSALIPKAMEWASMVKALGASLLSAFEKGDAEYLSALRTSHEHQILDLGTETSQNSFRAADWDYQALGKQLAGAQTRARYYMNLIEKGIIALELAYQQGMETSMLARASGNVEETVGQAMNMIPDFYIGFPAALNHLPLGTKLAGFFSTIARIQNVIADINSSEAGLSETQASWVRRAEEWQHQLNVTEIEIEQIKRQQLASARRRQSALRELNNHQRQLEHSQEVADFMRDRISKHELYLFLQQETSVLYKQAFRLALQCAKEAQAAVWYECGHFSFFDSRGELDIGFDENELWNSLHEGLLAGEKLELSLRALERKYMMSMCREYELTKHISLRQFAPFAFLILKTGEECEVELPEWWFDLDYPGHYMRRIKQVSLSLPCVAGPLAGVHCRLQLLSSKVRVRPLLPPASECCCAKEKPAVIIDNPSLRQKEGLPSKPASPAHSQKKNCIECCCGHNSKQLPDDPYILHAHHTSSSHIAIATSTGTIDPGIFESNPEQTRYLPFEFAGASSRWRISLPAQNNAFSLATLSDVVMHINYTAREGGQELRQAAEAAVCGRNAGDGIRFLDVKHDMAEGWRVAFGPPYPVGPGSNAYECDDVKLSLSFTKNMFPFVQGGRYKDIWVTKIHVFFEIMEDEEYPSSNDCDEVLDATHSHFEVTYLPPQEAPTARETQNPGPFPPGVPSQRNPGPFPPKLPTKPKHSSCRHKERLSKNPRQHKPSHFFNYQESDSETDSESEDGSDDGDSKSDCNCEDNIKDCAPDLRRRFALVSSPSCNNDRPSSCLPTTYYGTLNPVRPLGPIREDRRKISCAQLQDLGSFVFPADIREREVESMYLLVEYEFSDCRVDRKAKGEGEKNCGCCGRKAGVWGKQKREGWERRWERSKGCCD